ncbi:MAG: tetratricopeptide repeat protein [Planctomycetota bacterium]|jgi:tetratricopeptide (TPR) repeat protein
MLATRWRQLLGLAWLAAGVGPVACGEKPEPPAVAVPPVAVDAALAAAEQYFTRRELPQAEAILATLIEKAPREPRAHELYGRLLYVKGVEAGQRGDPRLASALIGQAYERYRMAVDSAGDFDPGSGAGLEQSAGEIAVAAGRPDAALGHFQRAGRLDPINPKHALFEAQVLLQMRRLEGARSALKRVLVLDPDEAFAHASLATLALEENDHGKAIEHIEEARRIAPRTLALRIQEAKVRRLCGQPRWALELLVTLGEQPRAEEAVAHEIAECYRILGEPAKAAEAWAHRYHRRQGRATAWRAAVRAAEALLEAGRRDEAWSWYEEARRIAPEAPEVRSLERSFEADERSSEGAEGRRGAGAQGQEKPPAT